MNLLNCFEVKRRINPLMSEIISKIDERELEEALISTGKLQRYQKRGGRGNIFLQWAQGFAAEAFVRDILHSRGDAVAGDFKIEKNYYLWQDLATLSGKKIGVKGTRQYHDNGWIIQNEDPLDAETYFLVEHSMKYVNDTALFQICYEGPIKGLVQGLPRKVELQDNKRAIYPADNPAITRQHWGMAFSAYCKQMSLFE